MTQPRSVFSSIYISSPIDAGVPVEDSEHEKYCRLVAQAVSELYLCPVTVELEEVNTMEVTVNYRPLYSEHNRASVIEAVKSIAQDVWENGDFWE